MYGNLTITVLRASLSKDICTFATMDPVFKASISPYKFYVSSERTNEGLYPLWNETFTFNLEGEPTVSFEIMHNKTTVKYYSLITDGK